MYGARQVKRERGFIVWVYLAVFVFIAAAGATVVTKYNSAVEGRKDAEAARDEERTQKEKAIKQANDWKNEAARLQGDLDTTNKLLKDKDDDAKRLQQKLRRSEQAMAALAASSASARDYLSAPVDNGVRLQRRASAGCAPDLSVQCVPEPSGPDAAAADARRDEQGPDRGERRSAGGSR